MAHQTANVGSAEESIARYLGHSFPTCIVDRYRDETRGVIGFRFVGSSHGNVEFSQEWLQRLPLDENGLAHELHLQHASAEISQTPPGQRLLFSASGIVRETLPV